MHHNRLLSALCAAVFAVLGLFGGSVALAQDGTALTAAIEAVGPEPKKDPWKPAVSLTVTGRSNYITSNGYANGSVIQEDLYLSWACGAYFDLWHSWGTNDRKLNSDFRDEVDYTIGFVGTVKPFGFDLDYDLSVAYFDLYKLGVGRGDIINPALILSHCFDAGDGHALTPSFKVENVFTIPEWEDRWHFTGGLTHSVDLDCMGMDGLTFTQTAKVMFDNGNSELGNDSGLLASWRPCLAVPLDHDKSVTLSVFYEHCWTQGGIRDREDSHGVGMSLNIKF